MKNKYIDNDIHANMKVLTILQVKIRIRTGFILANFNNFVHLFVLFIFQCVHGL